MNRTFGMFMIDNNMPLFSLILIVNKAKVKTINSHKIKRLKLYTFVENIYSITSVVVGNY